jgi:hypothetical protein
MTTSDPPTLDRALSDMKGQPLQSTAMVNETWDAADHIAALEQNFPRCVPEPVLIDHMAKVLENHGFTARTSINLVSTCRDEICRPFTEYLDEKWGTPSFNISSLAGMVFCGRTGEAPLPDLICCVCVCDPCCCGRFGCV